MGDRVLRSIITCVTVLPSKVKLWSESFGVGSNWTPTFLLKIEFTLNSTADFKQKKRLSKAFVYVKLCTAAIFDLKTQ